MFADYLEICKEQLIWFVCSCILETSFGPLWDGIIKHGVQKQQDEHWIIEFLYDLLRRKFTYTKTSI